MTAGGNRSSGFTIVETMIVLAVSAALLFTGMLYVNGRQNRTMFTVAINDEKQYIEQVINETSNGFYPRPSSVTFNCTGSLGTQPTFTLPGTKAQGTNSGCTFLGKVLVYDIGDKNTGVVYPLVGNQRTSTSPARDVQSFGEALPVLLGPDTASPARWPNLSTTHTLENGLSFGKARYYYTDGTNVASNATNGLGILVFANTLSQYTQASGNLTTSAQKLDLFKYPAAIFGMSGGGSALSSANFVTTYINANAATPYPSSAPTYQIVAAPPAINTIPKVELCFVSGSTNQVGIITVTGYGQLGVSLKILDMGTCP